MCVFCRLLLPFRQHIFSHIVFFICIIYTIFHVFDDCSDDVDMTGYPPLRTAPAVLETKHAIFGGRRSHSPLPPIEQLWLPLLFLSVLIYLFIYLFIFSCCFFAVFFAFSFLEHFNTFQNNKISKFTVCTGGGRVVRWCWVNCQCRGVLQF